MTLPYPWHAAHGRLVITCPIIERVTCCVSPRPLQIPQVLGFEPVAHPEPEHFSHVAAVSKFNSRSVPKHASAKSRSTRISASCPARIRARGPRFEPPPPKKASMMSPKPKFCPPPNCENGSPPMS